MNTSVRLGFEKSKNRMLKLFMMAVKYKNNNQKDIMNTMYVCAGTLYDWGQFFGEICSDGFNGWC